MSFLTCIIVDDDDLSRAVIEHYAERHDALRVVASCADAIEAANVLQREDVDLVFLDVEMPGASGLDLLRRIRVAPVTVLVTAHPIYAVEAFALGVRDYLLKPVSPARLEAALGNVAPLLGFLGTVHYYLDDLTLDMGPTALVPGSHRAGRAPDGETDWNGRPAQSLLVNAGDAMLFLVLCASASYIAVPAAMRIALPKADPSVYLTLSLAITFPFNLTVGIPLYTAAARLVIGG